MEFEREDFDLMKMGLLILLILTAYF